MLGEPDRVARIGGMGQGYWDRQGYWERHSRTGLLGEAEQGGAAQRDRRDGLLVEVLEKHFQ